MGSRAVAISTRLAYEVERKIRELAIKLVLDEDCPMSLVAYVLQKESQGATASSIRVATAAKASSARIRPFAHHKQANEEDVRAIISWASREQNGKIGGLE